MTHLGLNIKKIRERWDLSQEEFGLLIGATRGMVMQYEKRGTKPKNETVSQIIKLTGLTADMLFNSELSDDELPEMDMTSRMTIDNYRLEPELYEEMSEVEEKELLRMNTKGRIRNAKDREIDPGPSTSDQEYVEFLKSNDAFFKNQYAVFNQQVLANLTALLGAQQQMLRQQQNLEALVKINLEHTGNVEAHQLGVAADVVHDNINRDILAAAGVGKGNAVGSPGKG